MAQNKKEMDIFELIGFAKNGGGGGSGVIVYVDNKELIFRSGGSVDGTILTIGGNNESN